MKKSVIVIWLTFFFTCQAFSQFTLTQLQNYSSMSYDELDSVLIKKKFVFETTKHNTATWSNIKGDRIGLMIQPDTITLMREGQYAGYADVYKRSIIYAFTGEIPLLSTIKSTIPKIGSSTTEKGIEVLYENELWRINVSKQYVTGKYYYAVVIDGLGYEVIRSNLK